MVDSDFMGTGNGTMTLNMCDLCECCTGRCDGDQSVKVVECVTKRCFELVAKDRQDIKLQLSVVMVTDTSGSNTQEFQLALCREATVP